MKIEVKQNFLDRAISVVAPQWGVKRMSARTRIQLANQFKGSSSTRLTNNWIVNDDDSTPDLWELETLRNRSRDLNRNDPVASGATDTMGVNVVGQGLKLQSRIRGEHLGVTQEQAGEYQKKAEKAWQDWCQFADSGNRLDFDEIQFLAFRKIIEDGEVIALPIMANEPWREIKRCIEIIEGHRLTAEDDPTGIKTGARGQPKAYTISSTDNNGATTYKTIQARDTKGRPRVIHSFPTRRPGQMRGIPFFAPVLTYFKDLADYLEAEVVAARVAACLAVFITKNEALAGAYGAHTSTDTDGNKIQGIEPGLIGYLEPGEAVNVVDPKRPGDAFPAFVETVLRHIGMSLGLPYEVLVKDFSKTNYSSARAALLEARRNFMTWRGWFSRKFCQPIYELVLEEAFLRGKFDVPGFYENKTEYCRGMWIGGGWGWVDPVKEVEASRKAIDYGLSTLAKEVAGQGEDWEETLEQQRKEQDRINDLGITVIRSRDDNMEKEKEEGE